ncbi:MAG: DUF1569 domain-containing protein [Planctomycetota bacterium]
MAVDVKKAERRELHFKSIDEVLAEAETFTEQSTATGNWTPAQNVHHVAFAISMLNHGVDLKIPLPMKLFGRVLKLFGAHVKPINPGIKPPKKVAEAFAPPADVTLSDAVQKLRDEVTYANEHGMHHPSPLFGKLTPDEAIKLNCRHAELHFGFIYPAAS